MFLLYCLYLSLFYSSHQAMSSCMKFITSQYSTLRRSHNLFIQSPIDGQSFVITNNVAINNCINMYFVCVQLFMQDKFPEVELLDQRVKALEVFQVLSSYFSQGWFIMIVSSSLYILPQAPHRVSCQIFAILPI